jgi:hypothetical protein
MRLTPWSWDFASEVAILLATQEISKIVMEPEDRLCGLVVKVSCYWSRGPGSIPCTIRFSEK